MTRPLMDRSIAELEQAAERNRLNKAELLLLHQELVHRSTTRALQLRERVISWLSAFDKQSGASDPMSGNKDKVDPRVIDDTQEAVAKLRAKLIDLSRKSPLINFRHGGRSASILRIVDERPDLIFEALHKSGMQFEPLPDADETPKDELTDEFRIAYERGRLTDEEFLAATDKLGDHEDDADALQAAERSLRMRIREQLGLPRLDYGKSLDIKALARANGVNPSFDLDWSDEGVEDHHTDDHLRVLLTEKELQKRLKAIWDRYRSHYRETGIHTLYLACGFVEWQDDKSSTTNHAPVLLQAVELHREVKRSRYEYTLRPHDEGLQVNIALIEKMREHWGLKAPELREEETPESYFVRLLAVLDEGSNLELRNFVTLAVLPFPQMILWKDLDPENWTDDAFGKHRLLPALMGAAPMHGEPSPSDPYDIDEPDWAERAPALVSPADASQHSALIEVAEGADLAIEGPPGTGKSQTITNIIADAIAEGKKVLFVAEKQAALQVVANRLREAGLGPLVLELHGENANRTQVYDGLRERLASVARHDAGHLNLQRGRLKERREQLRLYLARLQDRPGQLDRTVYDLFWRQIHLGRNVPATLQEQLTDFIACPKPTAISAVELEQMRGKLEIFGQALQSLEGRPRTLWLSAASLPVFDQAEPLRLSKQAGEAAQALLGDLQAFQNAGPFQIPVPSAGLEPLVDQIEAFQPLVDVTEQEAIAALRVPDIARSAMGLQVRWRRLYDKLTEDISDPQNCDRPTVIHLGEQLARLDTPPETVSQARAQATTANRIASEAQGGREAADSLTSLLRLPDDLPLSTILILGQVFVRLANHPASARALMDRSLLDPLSELAISEQSEKAAGIAQAQENLAQIVHEETLHAEPAELQELADTLENSGIFARMFGGEYKRAKRRSARLLRDSAERLQNVETLREAAQFRQSVNQFQDASAVRPLFPAMLWKGHDSDFATLEEARLALRTARFDLGEAQLDTALDQWLGLDSDGREKAGRLAARFTRVVEELAGVVEPTANFLAATAAIETRRDTLKRITELLNALGARETGHIIREGDSLPARIETFDTCREQFEQLSRGEGLDWIPDISTPLDGLGRALEQVGQLQARPDPFAITTALTKSEQPVALSSAISKIGKGFVANARQWDAARAILFDSSGIDGRDLDDSEAHETLPRWQSLHERLEELAADKDGAREAAKLLSDKADLDERGLTGLCHAAMEGQLDPASLADAYELRVVSALMKHHLHADGAMLQRMGGLNLADARKQFARIDKELHELEAMAILADRLDDRPEHGVGHGRRGDFTDMALLDHELGLKRPRTPMRDVIHRAGTALQTLKPVWMMSPASAAQYIQPGAVDFDVLVVDEASQMRPEFAVSSIMRAKQFVVVGDANQLPPSNHFGARTPDGDGDDGVGVDADAESILDVANQRFRRKRRLKWHYRSRHESLIKFSNREFYDDDLVVFPSPSGDSDELLGAKVIYVPERKPGTFYASSINQKEAEAILEEALHLMSNYPQYSLGIAAMNAQQAELLAVEFDRLRLEHPVIDRYVEHFADTVDEFFIKNLENVQGDERDIILVSTVYGPDKDGNVLQRFGLMNQEVGWRRLNVLVTRAKMSIRVFTSLRPGDVKVTPTSSRGIRAFNAYLTYLNQHPTVDNLTAGEAESDFEWVVAERLRAEGFECVPQVGVNRFRIDIGVRHPDCGDVFLAGIECDGAPYHTGFTVRDRDRIRQQVLEGLYWKIYRIWSVDWYQDPEREIGKLLAWLEKLRSAATIERIEEITQEASSATVPSIQPAAVIIESEQVNPSEPIDEPEEPQGRRLQPLDGIEWYETRKGVLYTIWEDGAAKGEVEKASRTTSTSQLYGDRISIDLPEYEAAIFASDETRKFNDLYAAVRFVGKA